MKQTELHFDHIGMECLIKDLLSGNRKWIYKSIDQQCIIIKEGVDRDLLIKSIYDWCGRRIKK